MKTERGGVTVRAADKQMLLNWLKMDAVRPEEEKLWADMAVGADCDRPAESTPVWLNHTADFKT